VDRTAAHAHAGFYGLFVGVETRKRREQRGVDVEHQARSIEERRGEHAHVPIQTDGIELVAGERVEQPTFVVGARLALGVRDDLGRNFPIGRAVEDRRARVSR
jgi:hypothetical protein